LKELDYFSPCGEMALISPEWGRSSHERWVFEVKTMGCFCLPSSEWRFLAIPAPVSSEKMSPSY
jgi:hypothetical protein